jgi:hypothetical protein
MAKLTRNHLDFATMGKTASKSDSMERTIVTNRVLQHDTDFACYRVAANMDETIEQCVKRVLSIVTARRRQAGASFANMHLTVGLKSGRKEMATVEAYQDKRNKKSNPELAYRVEQIRATLASRCSSTLGPVVSHLIEADDNLRMYQIKQIEKYGIESSVMDSGDKDLWFTDGWHMADDGSFYFVDGFGHTEYREVGNVKPKLVGEGTSWFWHQMIMGDGVDNIPGLPKISNTTLDIYFPLKKGKRKAGNGSCGEAKAVGILANAVNEAEAMILVVDTYMQYWGDKWVEMFVEQAFLLWIRRTSKLTDVIDYLNEIGSQAGYMKFSFSEAQKTRLREYLALVKANGEAK